MAIHSPKTIGIRGDINLSFSSHFCFYFLSTLTSNSNHLEPFYILLPPLSQSSIYYILLQLCTSPAQCSVRSFHYILGLTMALSSFESVLLQLFPLSTPIWYNGQTWTKTTFPNVSILGTCGCQDGPRPRRPRRNA